MLNAKQKLFTLNGMLRDTATQSQQIFIAKTYFQASGSKPNVILPTEGHVTMSEDTFGGRGSAGLQQEETGDGAKHPA